MSGLNGKRIVVTGGAGFIGSHLVDDLVETGANVVVYDDFSSGVEANLAGVRDRIEVVEGDILDMAKLSGVARGADFISHQAAQLEIFRATDDPFADLDINTRGTLNVLQVAEEHGVRKVINASSACVYGQTDEATDEESLPMPNWTYGVSKLAAERYARIFHVDERAPTISLRYSIVYGEREWYRRAATLFIKRVIEGKPPVVFGRGDQVRDFLHVSDLVRLHRACLETDRADGAILNVGSGRGATIRELAEAVVRAGGSDIPVEHEDVGEGEYSKIMPDKRRNRSDLGRMHLDCGLARELLDWEPRVGLEEGLAREMAWARAHPDRWEKVVYTSVNPRKA